MIGILGIIFIIVAPFFVYRAAQKHGYQPVYWALIAFAVGIASQILIPLVAGIIFGVVLVAAGNSPNSVQTIIQSYSLIIGIASLILSIIGVLLVMRRVSKAKDSDQIATPAQPEI